MHALDQMTLRGATWEEVEAAVARGEQFPAKTWPNRISRNFPGEHSWRGTKQLEVYAVFEDDGWLIITVIAKYF
jgi:hypothetical protein